MTEMVERVAKALVHRIGSPWPYDEMDPMIRALWEGHARAAIEAMREPTGEMRRAGYANNVIKNWSTGEMHHIGANEAWKAMIAAALGDSNE